MKNFIVCTFLLLVLTAVTNAQDIETTLSGNTTTQGFTVKSFAGTPLFTVRADGKIGLGILNPDALLHVAGQVKITGGSPGAGKLLTSDANGLATWTMLSSLPPDGPAGGDLTGSYPNPTIANSAITSAKIAVGAVTLSKISIAGATTGEVLTYDGTKLAWSPPTSTGVTLDQAYDMGGAGAGRTITADAGAVVIAGVDGFLVTAGSTSQGSIPASGAGSRMMWYPKKRAFRAGEVLGTQWDDANIAGYSMATGLNTTASGTASSALGHSTTASGSNSTALGWLTTASAHASIAMGYGATASGTYSIATGQNTTASGSSSTAMGAASIASGSYSTAMGSNSTASGNSSTSMGNYVTASGNYTTAIGRYASTGGYAGSMAIGDNSTSSLLTNTAENQWIVRFAGGIRFYTNSAMTMGSYMSPNTSGWMFISDRNKKENFTVVDGEDLLSRLRSVPVSEWNYKGTDASIRYIGPMAQDFWQAFHLGGTDSLGINSVAIDGVNMAAIQALEKRTAELNEKTAELQRKTDEIASLKEKVATLENAQAQYAAQAAELRRLKSEFDTLRTLLTEKTTEMSVKHASLDAGK